MSAIKAFSARNAERNRAIEERQSAMANATALPSAFCAIDPTSLRSILAAASADIMGAVAVKLAAVHDGEAGTSRSAKSNPFGKPATGPIIDADFKVVDPQEADHGSA